MLAPVRTATLQLFRLVHTCSMNLTVLIVANRSKGKIKTVGSVCKTEPAQKAGLNPAPTLEIPASPGFEKGTCYSASISPAHAMG